ERNRSRGHRRLKNPKDRQKPVHHEKGLDRPFETVPTSMTNMAEGEVLGPTGNRGITSVTFGAEVTGSLASHTIREFCALRASLVPPPLGVQRRMDTK